MSWDASYFIVDGQLRSYYNRVGGYSLPIQLLNGPASFIDYVRASTREINGPWIDTYFHGVAIVDVQRRSLFWWSDGLHDALWRRTFEAMLAEAWADWDIQTSMLPALDLAARLPELRESLLGMGPDDTVVTPEQAAEQHFELIREVEQEPGLRAYAAEVGFMKALEVIEWDHRHTWLRVRDHDGTLRDDYLVGYWPETTLRAGPELLDLIATRPRRTLEKLYLAESELQTCIYVDRIEQELHWWMTAPRISRHPLWELEAMWPGWRCEPQAAGPRGQFELSGGLAIPLVREHCIENLRQHFEIFCEYHSNVAPIRRMFDRLLLEPAWQPTPDPPD